MSERRYRPVNRWGCKPTDDVCIEHDEPLVCRHGCEQAKAHQCADLKANALEAAERALKTRKDDHHG